MSKDKKKENVTIKTKSVSIQNSGNNPKNKRKRKNRGKNTNSQEAVPTGVQTGLAEFHEVLHDRPELPEGCSHFSEQARNFILNYIDPCGEHVRSLDAARVPDATLDVSSPSFARGLSTMVFSFQSGENILTDSRVYSMLVIQVPLMRALAIVLADKEGKEFDNEAMNKFNKVWANIVNKEDHYYPRETAYSDTGVFTILDTKPLRKVIPPGENGISSTIDSYRFSGNGFDVFYNTPDLLNQGTLTTLRYPVNQATKVIQETSPVVRAAVRYIRYIWSTTTVGLSLFLNSGTNIITGLPSFSGAVPFVSGPIGDPFPAFGSYRNGSGSFTVADGAELQYVMIITPGDSVGTVRLVNQDNLDFITICTVNNAVGPGIHHIGSERIYETSGPDNITTENKEIRVIGLPPVTQAQMFQNDPKCFIELSKEFGGSYQTGRIYQPVFNVTHSSTYAKVVFSNADTDLAEISNDLPGWEDTVDQNFSFQVANYQSIPYACKPLVKHGRTMEIVPGEESVLALTTTGCPPRERGVVEFCAAFSEAQPHGYPTDYNSLGILFSKVVRAVELLPRLLRTGENISEVVTQTVDDVRNSGLLRGRRTNHRESMMNTY
jgi:hypothetical protein